MKIFKNMMILVALIISVNMYAGKSMYAAASNTFTRKGQREEFLSAIERIKAKKRVDDDDMVILIKYHLSRFYNPEIEQGIEELKKILPDIEDQVSQAAEAETTRRNKQRQAKLLKSLYDETTQTLKKDGVRKYAQHSQRMLKTTYLRPNEILREVYNLLVKELQRATGESKLNKGLADELMRMVKDVLSGKENTPKRSDSQYKKSRR
jgi:transcriptional antiterminator Rof (Rho-off)